MYIPEAYKVEDLAELHAFIRRYSFATVVTGGSGELTASHLPVLLDADRGPHGTLVGHLARANGQWKSLQAGEPALAIFHGPHAYVSPTWYESRPAVPTWNYAAVHASGPARLIEDPEALLEVLRCTSAVYEASRPEPWTVEAVEEFARRLLPGIVGFEIEIERLEGKFKLSQNRPEADRSGTVAGLLAEGDPESAAVAQLMMGRGVG